MLPSLVEEAKRAQRRSAVTRVRFGHGHTGNLQHKHPQRSRERASTSTVADSIFARDSVTACAVESAVQKKLRRLSTSLALMRSKAHWTSCALETSFGGAIGVEIGLGSGISTPCTLYSASSLAPGTGHGARPRYNTWILLVWISVPSRPPCRTIPLISSPQSLSYWSRARTTARWRRFWRWISVRSKRSAGSEQLMSPHVG